VVLAAAVGLFWGVPVTVYSFAVFLKPLMQEFHAGRAAVSLAFTLQPSSKRSEHQNKYLSEN
jgi:hypothetical protein